MFFKKKILFIIFLILFSSCSARNFSYDSMSLEKKYALNKIPSIERHKSSKNFSEKKQSISHSCDSEIGDYHLIDEDFFKEEKYIKISDLSEMKIYDVNSKLISAFPNFQKLDSSFLTLSEKKIIEFLNTKSSKKIDFSYNQEFNDEILFFLKYAPNLDSISLKETNLTDKSLLFLKDLHHLKSLDLSYNQISNIGLKNLSNLNLSELNLESNERIDELGIFYLSDSIFNDSEKLLNLKKINLAKTNVSALGLHCLKKFKGLEDLNLQATAIDDRSIKDIVQFKKIKSLNLAETNITDTSLPTIGSLRFMEKLNLSHNLNISNKSIFHLRDLPLMSISLAGTSIDDQGIDYLLHFNLIRKLDISDTFVTDNGVLKLSDLLYLEELNLSKNRNITEESLIHLKRFKNNK